MHGETEARITRRLGSSAARQLGIQERPAGTTANTKQVPRAEDPRLPRQIKYTDSAGALSLQIQNYKTPHYKYKTYHDMSLLFRVKIIAYKISCLFYGIKIFPIIRHFYNPPVHRNGTSRPTSAAADFFLKSNYSFIFFKGGAHF